MNKLPRQQTRLSLSGMGRPTENGLCARRMRTLKEAEVSLQDYADAVEAGERIGHFVEEVSMRKRVHSSLGDPTPAEWEGACDERSGVGSGKDAVSAERQPKQKTPAKNRRRPGGCS